MFRHLLRRSDYINRPLVGAFLSMAAGIGICFIGVIPWQVSILTVMVLILLLLLLYIRRRRLRQLGRQSAQVAALYKKYILLFSYSIIFLFSYFNIYTRQNHKQNIIDRYLNSKITVAGRVDKISEGDYSTKYFIHTTDRRIEGDIVVEFSKNRNLKVGDVVNISGTLQLPKSADNPGQLNMREYYNSLGYFYYFKNPKVQLIKQSSWYMRALLTFKDRLKRVYIKCCDIEDAGIMEAVFLGDKSDMDEELKEMFTAGGIGHILAISGLHISVMGMGLFKFLRKIGGGYPVSAALSFIFVVLYGILTGNSVSATRAIIMFSCAVLSKAVGRVYDVLSAMALAGVVILIGNPYMLTNAGFWLSFMAIVGVSVVRLGFNWGIDRAKDHFVRENQTGPKRVIISAGNAFLSSLSINLATLPITLWFYYEVPVYSVLLNLFVIPLMGVVMASTILTGVCGMINLVLGRFMAGITHYIIVLFSAGCNFTAALPRSSLVAGRPKLWQVFIYYLGLIIFVKWDNLHIYSNRHLKRLIKYALLIASLIMLIIRFRPSLEITFLSIGQGDAVCVLAGNRCAFIDGGSSSKDNAYEQIVEPFLKYKGINKIDYLFITHGDKDHFSAWSEAVSTENAGRVYIPSITYLIINNTDIVAEDCTYDDLYKSTIDGMVDRGTCVYEDRYTNIYRLGDYSFESVNPHSRAITLEGENDNSIVLLLTGQDFNALFCGDISSEQERRLKTLPKIDILKVAHHGSKYSSSDAFLWNISPEYSVISCGKNNMYGHPHEETILRLMEVNSTILRTDEQGAVTFTTDSKNNSFVVKCEN